MTADTFGGRIVLGRYEVVRLLGEGGMGKVYLARQLMSRQPVVIKVMREELAAQPSFADNFRREMALMARLRHPHVVTLLDASPSDPGGPCIVMEYIDGLELDEILRRQRRLTPERVGRLLAQLCSALEAAHRLGIIHRDLKPANVMITRPDHPEESLKVMDFGLAKLGHTLHIDLRKFQGSSDILVHGTPDYVCPEQVRGDDSDHRGDIYSVGVMLYELLTGRRPFVRGSLEATLRAHVEDEPPSFQALGLGQQLSPRLESVVRQCLAKFPVERPQTARELIQRYEDALGQTFRVNLANTEETVAELPVWTTPPSEAPPRRLDPNTVVHHFQAWMPERIAVVKIRGFVADVGGEVVESVPGMIRLQLGGPGCHYQLPRPRRWFDWLPWGRPASPMFEVELHFSKAAETSANVVNVTALFPPASAAPAKAISPVQWQEFCDRVFTDLRSYLMGR
ncbi:MAG: serine/threonine protein kinase [Gemmataceae bacterium]|nr:serine/threonine protein kinase [Gemmataceae bacterium]MDW8264700.1 serine/threonine-protein kinase [Gemmataceae bacterium]